MCYKSLNYIRSDRKERHNLVKSFKKLFILLFLNLIFGNVCVVGSDDSLKKKRERSTMSPKVLARQITADKAALPTSEAPAPDKDMERLRAAGYKGSAPTLCDATLELLRALRVTQLREAAANAKAMAPIYEAGYDGIATSPSEAVKDLVTRAKGLLSLTLEYSSKKLEYEATMSRMQRKIDHLQEQIASARPRTPDRSRAFGNPDGLQAPQPSVGSAGIVSVDSIGSFPPTGLGELDSYLGSLSPEQQNAVEGLDLLTRTGSPSEADLRAASPTQLAITSARMTSFERPTVPSAMVITAQQKEDLA